MVLTSENNLFPYLLGTPRNPWECPDPISRTTGSVNVPDELEDRLDITSSSSSSPPDRELSSGTSSEKNTAKNVVNQHDKPMINLNQGCQTCGPWARTGPLRGAIWPTFLPVFFSFLSYLPFFLALFLPSFLLSFLPSFCPSFVPSSLLSFLPSFCPSCISSFLPSFFPPYLPFFLSLFLLSFCPSYLPSFLPSIFLMIQPT